MQKSSLKKFLSFSIGNIIVSRVFQRKYQDFHDSRIQKSCIQSNSLLFLSVFLNFRGAISCNHDYFSIFLSINYP
ncbi:MAG: hypothetical protein JW776_09495, partial [Candidatus Lokiarchaeota archaeon]|nr:hypothetical protein [Candidatus Lokiarchaeota archaeon]